MIRAYTAASFWAVFRLVQLLLLVSCDNGNASGYSHCLGSMASGRQTVFQYSTNSASTGTTNPTAIVASAEIIAMATANSTPSLMLCHMARKFEPVCAAMKAANELIDDLDDPMFGLIMFCFPPGNPDPFLSFAYPNSKYSFYNNE